VLINSTPGKKLPDVESKLRGRVGLGLTYRWFEIALGWGIWSANAEDFSRFFALEKYPLINGIAHFYCLMLAWLYAATAEPAFIRIYDNRWLAFFGVGQDCLCTAVIDTHITSDTFFRIDGYGLIWRYGIRG